MDFCDEITTHCQPRVMWSLLAAVAFSELARAGNANPSHDEKASPPFREGSGGVKTVGT
eukprot:COSAG06_NODE_18257_length_895_cov_273.311558_1_plen_59_part_00